jgi:Rrf2 family protein
MLRLSRKVDYGLAFLSELANNPKDWTALSEVSGRRKISSKFLSQLAMALRGAGLIISKEGIGGGYKLVKKPSDINIKEVVEALEGKMALVDCFCASGNQRCSMRDNCDQKEVWSRVQNELGNTLARITLADFK